MDDHKFDSFLKGKLDEFQDDSFQEGDLDSLHYKLSLIEKPSFYQKNRTELLVAGMLIIFTLFNVYFHWNWEEKLNKKEIENKELIAGYQDLISTFQKDLTKYKNDENKQVNPTQLQDVPNLKNDSYSYGKTKKMLVKNPQKVSGLEDSFFLFMEDTIRQELVENIFRKLYQDGYLIKDEKSYALLIPSELHNNRYTTDIIARPFKAELLIDKKRKTNSIIYEKEEEKKAPKKHLSTKTLRAIEKHYMNGIGINFGILADISSIKYEMGKGDLSPGVGIFSEFVFSPSIMAEIGSTFKYTFSEFENYQIEEGSFMLSELNQDELKVIDEVEIGSFYFEIPMAFKYKYPLTMNSNLIFSFGLSPYLYLKQNFNYKYDDDDMGINSFTSSKKENQPKLYAGTINTSLGYRTSIDKKKAFEIGFFYKTGSGKIGLEQNQIKRSFGIQTAFLFKAK